MTIHQPALAVLGCLIEAHACGEALTAREIMAALGLTLGVVLHCLGDLCALGLIRYDDRCGFVPQVRVSDT